MSLFTIIICAVVVTLTVGALFIFVYAVCAENRSGPGRIEENEEK